MQNSHFSCLDGTTTPKKIQIFKNNKKRIYFDFVLNPLILKKNIEVFKKIFLNGRFV